MSAPVFFLALVFGVHIVAVNIGMALATIIPFLKRRAVRAGDRALEGAARGLFRIYAVTYALAGVMGTAFTVFLLSFYPEFVGIAGNITMVPFGIAVVSILFHFFAIVAYWYGWGRFSEGFHSLVGWLLTITAYTIPLGFRAVFAFLNTPQGLVLGEKPSLDVVQALLNPTFLPLYLKSVVGALTFGFLFIAGVYAYQGLRRELSGVERSLYADSLRIGLMGLLAMLFLGPWYTLALVNVPVKFNNIFAGLGAALSAPTLSNYSWLFLVKMALVILQAALLLYLLVPRGGETMYTPQGFKASIAAAAAAGLTVLTGEYLNAFSQYPYFVANAPLIADKLPEPYRTLLTRALNLENLSPLAQDPALYLATVVGVAVLLAAAGYMLYLVFFKEGGE
ncbi:MAG: cytochrome ubiquinol oxidase subunit I [Thermofilum sp.]|jgi:cytochrome d ubiquinol oxidase subunit I|nr:cytochrome ubiquinol oxidase subunit I [Thermofilum sp.]